MKTHDYVLYHKQYSEIGIDGTYYLAFRDIPAILKKYNVDGRILDYGCGTGRSTRFLKSLGFSVAGVDINNVMIDDARKNDAGTEYHLIESAQIPAAPDSFDAVFSSFVFLEVSSLKEITAILTEMKRVLKKDGTIVVVTSILSDAKNKFISFNYDFEENNSAKLSDKCNIVKLQIKTDDIILYDYNYTVAEYKRAIRAAGLTLEEIYVPLGSDADPISWEDEKTANYFHIFVLKKDREPDLTNDGGFMLKTANKLKSLAGKYCHPVAPIAKPMKSRFGNDDCEWYHAAWGYCRWLGLIASPDLHREFYSKFFSKHCSEELVNILVSGAADFAVLGHLINSIPTNRIANVRITVIDKCMTPLKICAWCNNERIKRGGKKVHIEFKQLNALDTKLHSESFDLITTYSFLSRFDDKSQKELVIEWARLLKAGGAVITSDRISPEYGTDLIVSTKEQITYFDEQAALRLKQLCVSRRKAEGIKKLIHNYAENIIDFSCPSSEALIAKFSGFECEQKTGIVRGEREVEETYATIYAEKPTGDN